MLLPLRDAQKHVYKKVLEETIRAAGYQPVRADLLQSSKSIHEDVLDEIERSALIIADLTHDNPNVNYEIGLSRSLGKPIIMISQKRDQESVPFYYKGQRILFYNRSKKGWHRAFSSDLATAIRNAVRTDPLSENQKLGLTAFFGGDNSAFETALTEQIERATRTIVGVGWGLAFLNAQRRHLMRKVADRVQQVPDLTVHLLLAHPDHPGLKARIEEEERYQPNTGIYSDWPITFFKFALELRASVPERDQQRVHIARVPYMPTAMIIKLDNIYFFRSYGHPGWGGWKCPWLRCDANLASPEWTRFLDENIRHAREHSVADPVRP